MTACAYFLIYKMYPIIKRIVEIPLALIMLIVLSPIILIAVALVISDGGPAFFTQERVGRNQRIFKVIKLRTMVEDAEALLDTRSRATKNRITRFGAVLRKLSIDEFPQLINIVKGDMSLIGPRPILPRMLPYLTEREHRRFDIRPGLTGLAQVKGRNYLRWSRRFHYDIIYRDRMSFWLDFYVTVSTIQVLLFGTGTVSLDTNPDQVDDVTVRSIKAG